MSESEEHKEHVIKYYFKTIRRDDGKLSVLRCRVGTDEVVCDLHVEKEWFVTLALDLLQRNPAELWNGPQEAQMQDSFFFKKPVYCV